MVSTRTSDAAAAVAGTSKVAAKSKKVVKATGSKAEQSKKKKEVVKPVAPPSVVMETAKETQKEAKGSNLMEKEVPLSGSKPTQAVLGVSTAEKGKKKVEKAKGSKKVKISDAVPISNTSVDVAGSVKPVEAVIKSAVDNVKSVESDEEKKRRGLVPHKGEWLTVDELVKRVREEALSESVGVNVTGVMGVNEPVGVTGVVESNEPVGMTGVVGSDEVSGEEASLSKDGDDASKHSEKESAAVGDEAVESEKASEEPVEEDHNTEAVQEDQHSQSGDKEEEVDTEKTAEEGGEDSPGKTAQVTEASEKQSDGSKVAKSGDASVQGAEVSPTPVTEKTQPAATPVSKRRVKSVVPGSKKRKGRSGSGTAKKNKSERPTIVKGGRHNGVWFKTDAHATRWEKVQKRTIVAEKVVIDAKYPGELVELFKRSRLYGSVTKADRYSAQLIREVIANLPADFANKESNKYGQIRLRGRACYVFPDLINVHLNAHTGKADTVPEDYGVIISELTQGKKNVWKGPSVQASILSTKYSHLYQIARLNWMPTANRGTVSKEMGQFLYAVGKELKVNLGEMVFDHLAEHATSNRSQLTIGFPSLIQQLVVEQLPDIISDEDDLSKPPVKFVSDYRLFQGNHAFDMPMGDFVRVEGDIPLPRATQQRIAKGFRSQIAYYDNQIKRMKALKAEAEELLVDVEQLVTGGGETVSDAENSGSGGVDPMSEEE